MIFPHSTGHATAANGDILRADIETHDRWVASRYRNCRCVARLVGSDEQVHKQIQAWKNR